jgi:hypothetical protein
MQTKQNAKISSKQWKHLKMQFAKAVFLCFFKRLVAYWIGPGSIPNLRDSSTSLGLLLILSYLHYFLYQLQMLRTSKSTVPLVAVLLCLYSKDTKK